MKILVLRFSSIGDVVLTTPILRCLAKQTGAELHYLTKPAFAPVVECNPYVKRLWRYEPGIEKALSVERFDALVDLQGSWRSWRLGRRLGVGLRLGFRKLNVRKWLLVRLGWNWLPRGLHVVDRYFESLAPLGVRNDGKGLDYFIPPECAQTSPFSLPYLAVAVGAAHATKALPYEQLERFCLHFTRPIVLLGGAAEAALGERLAALAPERIANFCGKLSLHGSASLLHGAHRVLAPDTGLMHIAAALRRPLYSVWGSTVPDFGMYPYYPQNAPSHLHQFIQTETPLRCRPCSKLGHPRCPQGHFRCMLDLDMVYWAARIAAEW